MVAKRTESAAEGATSTKKEAAKPVASKSTAKSSTKKPAAKSTAKKPAAKSTAKKPAGPSKSRLVVRGDESPWTQRELAAVRREIEADIAQLRGELDLARHELVDLMRDSGDGAGDDQADAGAKTYEREQELALADNARVMLAQNERALERLDDGSYGICESCGQPIGKLRLQAAPRATLCLPCKTRQERR